MGLSSNTIIHFTKTKESLEGILTNNFKVHYCKEAIVLANQPLTFHVPMVSFCDIPLSEIKNHIDKYGEYGIGMTKQWAERRGLNPVLYVENNSDLSKSYRTAYFDYFGREKKVIDLNKHEKCVMDIVRYIKNYQNDLIRSDGVIKDYRFSDEREWRYVPSYDRSFSMIVAADDITNEAQKDAIQLKLKDESLVFEPEDIKYIIIKDDSEISDFLDLLRRSKGTKYSYNDVERLMTRILTTEQIKTDI